MSLSIALIHGETFTIPFRTWPRINSVALLPVQAWQVLTSRGKRGGQGKRILSH